MPGVRGSPLGPKTASKLMFWGGFYNFLNNNLFDVLHKYGLKCDQLTFADLFWIFVANIVSCPSPPQFVPKRGKGKLHNFQNTES